MATRDDHVDLTVDIDEMGDVRVTSKAVKRRLAALAGKWRLLPTVGDLILWQRSDEAQRREGRGGVGLAGEIDGPGALGNILNFLQFNQWDGVLSVVTGAIRKSLFFKKGQVLAASSNLPEDRIGALLVRFGMVTDGALASAIRDVTPERRLGTVLVEKGLMSAASLYEGVRRQTEEIFYSVLLIVRGTFYFIKHLDEAALPTRLLLDTQALLLEGLRRIDEMSYFRAKIPSPSVILARRLGAPQTELTGDAFKVYDALTENKTLYEIARGTRLGEFAATKAAFALVQTGHVEVHQATDNLRQAGTRDSNVNLTPDATGAIIDAYNSALGRLYAMLSQKGKAQALRQGVRAFLSGSARFQDLFRGVALADDGTLPRRQLLLNIDGISGSERQKLLMKGLNELLFFALFVAGDAIDHKEEQELHERVAQALEHLPRPTNPGIERPT